MYAQDTLTPKVRTSTVNKPKKTTTKMLPPLALFYHHPLQSPRLTLVLLFLLTRLIYLTIALLTPSPAYDSSTNLILPPPQDTSGISTCWNLTLLTKLAERLTRWDAIYFVKISERGYIREQEWAFGWGWTRVMGVVGRGKKLKLKKKD